jgi:NACHT domain
MLTGNLALEDTLSRLPYAVENLQNTQEKNTMWQKKSTRDEKVKSFLKMLYTCPYRDRKERNRERISGTCEWFTNHSLFQNWNKNQRSSLLWVSADPGSGKSVLVKYLIDHILPSTSKRTTCYFFFKDDFTDQKTATNALCAVLRQLFLAKPHLLRDSILDKFDIDGDKFTQSFHDLWSTLTSIAADQSAGELVCILDALDECQDDDRSQLIQAVRHLYVADSNKLNLKFLLTSRPYDHIRREFRELESRLPTIHLSGENEVEIEKISREIDLVIQNRVEDISRKRSLELDERTFLQEQLTLVPNRTYLWVDLTLDVVENISGFTKGNVRKVIRQIPQTVDDAYNRILNRSSDTEKAKRLLHIVVTATRPLSLDEMSLIMTIEETHKSYDDIVQELEPKERFRGTLRDLCGLFLVIKDAKIYLLHQTAKEFLVQDDSLASLKDPSCLNSQYSPLKWKHSLQPKESNRILAERCIWYLNSDFIETHLRFLLDYSAHN